MLGDQLVEHRAAFLVVREDRVTDELGLLQVGEHVAVVARRQVVLVGDQSRERLHLVLNLAVRDLGAADQLADRHVDADALEVEGVELFRQAKVLACTRHQLLAQERLVGGELGLQGFVGWFTARQLELLEQCPDPLDVARSIAHVFLELVEKGPEQTLFVEARAHRRLDLVGNRGVARFQAGVAFQPGHGRVPTLGRHALVQQAAKTLEDGVRQIGVGQQEAIVDLDTFDVLVGGVDQNLEILADRGMLLRRQPLLELDECLLDGARRLFAEVERSLEDLGIETVDAELTGLLRAEPCQQIEQDLRVLVAAGDPIEAVRACRGRRCQQRGGGEGAQCDREGTPCEQRLRGDSPGDGRTRGMASHGAPPRV